MLAQIRREIATDPYYQQNFSNDGQRFVAWYLRRVLLRDPAAARNDITDGSNDKQIDAVVVDDDDRRVLIIQGKFVTAAQVDAEPLREVLGAWMRLQDLGSLQQDCNEKLKLKLEDVRGALDDEYRVDFELLTTGELTAAARADLRAYADQFAEFDVFSASLQLVDAEVIAARLKEAEDRDLPSINHTVAVDPQKTLEMELDGAKVIMTILPLKECLRFPGITDGLLFRKNVRQSLGANNRVNRALRETLNSENVREFFFYHNGVTAICHTAAYDPIKGSVSVSGLSVVNGCQSLSTIQSASERVRSYEAREAYILFRFYAIPDSSLADRISINTNAQSAVKPRDLRSNDKVMVGLKKAFEARYPGGLFMTKRGEARPADKDMRRTVDSAVLAKMLMAWHCQRPSISYNEKKLFDEHYKTLFRPGYDPASILAMQVWLNAIDESWQNLPLNDVLKAGRSFVKFHLLFSISAIIAAVNKHPNLVPEPSSTTKAADSPDQLLPLAATCLENALQSAINQAQVSGKVFSPQNWLKTNASVQGETLVAGTIAGMLPSLPNGTALLDVLRVPASAMSNRWSAD